MPPRALLFDLDDTLIDTRAAFRAGTDAVCGRYLAHLDGAGRDEAFRMWTADANGWYRRFAHGEMSFTEQRHRRADELHAALGGEPLDEAAFTGWNDLYHEHFTASWRLRAGVREVLEHLAAHGLGLGCVTNAGRDFQLAKLGAVGLVDLLPVLVTLDTFGVGKPDPRLFHEACRQLGVAPHEAAHVGDEPLTDAGAARSAGLTGVWLKAPDDHRPHPAAPPGVLTVTSLHELPVVLGLPHLPPATAS